MEESLEESSAFVPFVSFVCFVHMRLTCGFSFRLFRQFRQDMPKNGISSSINRSAVLWAALLLLGRGYAAHCMRV